MPFRFVLPAPRVSWRVLFGCLFGTVLLTGIAGCGGGDSTSGPVSTPTPAATATPAPTPTPSPTPTPARYVNARFVVSWAARSRDLTAPSSAQSLRVTVGGAAQPDGSDYTFIVNRTPNNLNTFTQGVTTFDTVQQGIPLPVSVRFHAEPNAEGAVVGVGDAQVTFANDGTGIGAITTASIIKAVELRGGQSLRAGEQKDLGFAARDAAEAMVAVSPGSAFFAVKDGADRLRFTSSQKAEALLPGKAQVTVLVDGIESPAAEVVVTSNAQVSVQPGAQTLLTGRLKIFTATVVNAPDTGVTWSVLEGAAGGTITQDGFYTAPQSPGTYTVVARSRYDAEKFASAVITVLQIGVAVTPETATLTLGEQRTFTANVTNTSNTGVLWNVEEGAAGGTITAGGVYTAPQTPGTYHVIAASAEDPARTARATIVVEAGSGTVIIR